MRLLRPVLAVVAAFFVVSVFAQESPQRDPQAVGILTQSLNLAVPPQGPGSIQDFTATGTITYFWAGERVSGNATVRARGAELHAFWLVPVSSQGSVPRDSRAVSILGQSLAAMGGQGVQDGIVEGTIRWANGQQGTIRQKSRGRDRLSQELTAEGNQTKYVISRGQGRREREGRSKSLPSWISRHQRPELVPALSRAADLLKPNMKVEYLGQESIAGQSAHHLRLSEVPTDETPPEILELLTEFHVWIDSQTFLVTKTRSYIYSPEIIENRSEVETLYSSYQDAGGVLVPTSIVRYVSGRKHSEITLTNVRWNVGLSDSDFQ